MPEHLSVEAKREWRKVLPLLLERGSLTQADASVVSLYCECFARWLEAKRDVEQHGLVVTVTTLDKRGEQVQNRKQNPALRIAQDCERSLRTYLRELGLTPAARERVLPTKPVAEKVVNIFDLVKKAKEQ
jgi:P27 family predicted phage terminase small subunit